MKFFTNWTESMVRGCVAAEVNTAFKSLACDPAHVANQLDMAANEVANRVDMDALAELLAEKVDVDTSEIARVVARNLDMDDVIEKVVEEIDMGQVCARCAEKIEIDTDDVADRAAVLVKEDIDMDSVAQKVAANIGWESDVLDYERLAKAMLSCFAKSIVKS